MNRKGFTLLEIMITLIIVGVLATLGLANYQLVIENTHDKRAQSDLRLIRNAERIYRMEGGAYVTCPTILAVNNNLRLTIPNPTPSTNAPWLYSVTATDPSTAFTAKAVRNVTDSRRRAWCVNQNPDTEPVVCTP